MDNDNEMIVDNELDNELDNMSCDDLRMRLSLLDNEIKIMTSISRSLEYDLKTKKMDVEEAKKSVELFKVPPFLISSIVEILDVEAEEDDDDGANVNLDNTVKPRFY